MGRYLMGLETLSAPMTHCDLMLAAPASTGGTSGRAVRKLAREVVRKLSINLATLDK